MSMNFNHQSTGGYTNFNNSDFQEGSIGNGGPGGNQEGSVSNGGPGTLPYIQTSWPSSFGATGVLGNDTTFQDIQGQNSEFDQMSINFNHHSTGGYTNLNGDDYQEGSISNEGLGSLLYI